MKQEQALIRRWRRGHRAAERRARELVVLEGPRPSHAVAEAIAAHAVVQSVAGQPGNDPVAEESLRVVRRRWARVQKRAKRSREA